MWGAARSAGGQGCRAQPAEEREARCALGRKKKPATRRPRDEALDAEHRSAVARRPQAVADRGRHRETATPAAPHRHDLRAPHTPANRFAPAKRQRRRHHTTQQPTTSPTVRVDPATARRMAPEGKLAKHKPSARNTAAGHPQEKKTRAPVPGRMRANALKSPRLRANAGRLGGTRPLRPSSPIPPGATLRQGKQTRRPGV